MVCTRGYDHVEVEADSEADSMAEAAQGRIAAAFLKMDKLGSKADTTTFIENAKATITANGLDLRECKASTVAILYTRIQQTALPDMAARLDVARSTAKDQPTVEVFEKEFLKAAYPVLDREQLQAKLGTISSGGRQLSAPNIADYIRTINLLIKLEQITRPEAKAQITKLVRTTYPFLDSSWTMMATQSRDEIPFETVLEMWTSHALEKATGMFSIDEQSPSAFAAMGAAGTSDHQGLDRCPSSRGAIR